MVSGLLTERKHSLRGHALALSGSMWEDIALVDIAQTVDCYPYVVPERMRSGAHEELPHSQYLMVE